MITIGVEEEFLLLDPRTGLPVALAERVRAAAGAEPGLTADEVQRELLQAQVETATPVCRELAEVGGHLVRLRHGLSAAAEAAGCRLAACGAAPFADRLPVPVTAAPRYRRMRADARRLTDEQLIAGMHVHVGVPDRAHGVAVLNGLRPWLPALVALAANSPFWQGLDTGFASWRTVVFGRWPVSGPPPEFDDAEEYGRRVAGLVDAGLIRDRAQVYWLARLSERYPTVEVRAMDVQPRADDAVMLAGLVRALASRVLDPPAPPLPPAPPPEVLAAAVWHAARYGCTDSLYDPLIGRLAPVPDVVARLLDFVAPALGGDDGRHVEPVLRRLLREGEPATRRRRLIRRQGRRGLVRMIVDETRGL